MSEDYAQLLPGVLAAAPHRDRKYFVVHHSKFGGQCLGWVKRRNTPGEQMFSALPPKPDIAQCSRRVRNVPLAEVALIRSPRRQGRAPWPGWSLGQPCLPQSFFISRDVLSTSIRAKHVFEIGKAQRGVQFSQPSHCLVCLLRPAGHCVACGGDT